MLLNRTALVICRKATKPQKVITLEDVESPTTVAPSPVVHKQQPKAQDIHSRVQELYPPNPYNSRSLSVNADNNDDEIMKKVLPEPSLPRPQKPPKASPIASVQVLQPPARSVVSADSTLEGTVHHDVDSATSSMEGRIADHDTACLSKEATKEKMKQQTPSKRRKKRVKTTSPKLVDADSNRNNLELKRPVSDDICSWLQLQDSESNELDERVQHASRSRDQSHDLSICDSQDAEESTHHQTSLNNSTKQRRSIPQLQRKTILHAQTSSSKTQHEQLSDSETVSSIQSTTSKY